MEKKIHQIASKMHSGNVLWLKSFDEKGGNIFDVFNYDLNTKSIGINSYGQNIIDNPTFDNNIISLSEKKHMNVIIYLFEYLQKKNIDCINIIERNNLPMMKKRKRNSSI